MPPKNYKSYEFVIPADGITISAITEESDMNDNVYHPKHYEGKVECIDMIVETQGVEAAKNFCTCNAFKYLYRHRNKGGDEDIEKAAWYLNKWKELKDESEDEIIAYH